MIRPGELLEAATLAAIGFHLTFCTLAILSLLSGAR